MTSFLLFEDAIQILISDAHRRGFSQSILGPFRPKTNYPEDWTRAAAKNAIFFADLMEGWKSDAPTGNTKRLRINSFERDNERYSGFFNPDGE